MNYKFTLSAVISCLFIASAAFSQSNRLSVNSGLPSNPVLDGTTRVLDPCTYSQPSNALEDGRVSVHDGNVNQSADDIFVPANTCMTIYRVKSNHFVIFTASSVNVYFFNNNGGEPGTSISTQSSVPFTSTYVGSNHGLDVYEVDANITPVTLCGGPSGTTYWLSVTLATGSVSYWEFQTITPYGSSGRFYGPDWGVNYWEDNGDHFVFSLDYTYSSELEDTVALCSGGSMVIGGVTVSSPGLYMDTVSTINGCDSIVPVRVEVGLPLGVSITPPPSFYFCANDNVYNIAGVPAGGTFTGPGIVNNAFDPSAANIGNNQLSYSYTDSVGCSGADTITLVVTDLPVVSFSITEDYLCVNSGNISLSGSPAGGTFSGPGVSGTTFNPSTAGVGNHAIIYSYTDGSGCSNTDTSSIAVVSCLGTDNAQALTFMAYPNPTTDIIRVEGQLKGATAEIHDLAGRTLISRVLEGEFIHTFDLSSLATGTYMLRIRHNGQVSSLPVIKTE